jgi:hypothetical protein
MRVAPLDRPALCCLKRASVGWIVTEVTRVLYLDGFATGRGPSIDLCATVVATTFIKRRRVDVKSLVVELHDRPRKSALFVVALNKLQVPIRVSAEAHELVSVVTGSTEEKESVVIEFRRDLIEVVSSIAVSAGPHVGLRRYLGEILA